MEDCIFCDIINKKLPSELLFEDDNVVVFKDIKPEAPIHWLVVPKKHVRNIMEADDETIINIIKIIKKIVAEKGIAEDGFRVVTNCGENAGQTINHIHFHILAGKKLV